VSAFHLSTTDRRQARIIFETPAAFLPKGDSFPHPTQRMPVSWVSSRAVLSLWADVKNTDYVRLSLCYAKISHLHIWRPRLKESTHYDGKRILHDKFWRTAAVTDMWVTSAFIRYRHGTVRRRRNLSTVVFNNHLCCRRRL